MSKDTIDVLEELKTFTLGLNGEDHVDDAIKRCPCDACRIVNWICNKEKELSGAIQNE